MVARQHRTHDDLLLLLLNDIALSGCPQIETTEQGLPLRGILFPFFHRLFLAFNFFEIKAEICLEHYEYSAGARRYCVNQDLMLICIVNCALNCLENKNCDSLHEAEHCERLLLCFEFKAQHVEDMRVDHSILESPRQACCKCYPVVLQLDDRDDGQSCYRYHAQGVEETRILGPEGVYDFAHSKA